MADHFFLRLRKSCEQKNTLLCVGLDPRLNEDEARNSYEAIMEKNKRLIDATAFCTAVFKPNSAFYEAHGPEGLRALEDTIALAGQAAEVIVDTKRNDIGATAEAYAAAIFGRTTAGCTTLNPYMGRNSVEPFLQYKDRGVFVLCITSNPSANELQTLVCGEDAKSLFLKTADLCRSWSDRIGLVVAGNNITALKLLRERHAETWFLAPGIGAQGGTMEDAVAAGISSEGFGLLPVVARAIAGADDPGKAAKEYVDQLNRARDRVLKSPGQEKRILREDLKRTVLLGLIKNKCFKTGEFVLKSGMKSPFYIDLRRIGSDPVLLDRVAEAYAKRIRGIDYDCIAGIPVAGLPLATAVAMKVGKPLIFPRMNAKSHGTGNKVEGAYEAGQKVLLLDDLITTGASKVEAAEILVGAGLVVNDLVVLLERGAQGRKDMEEAGIKLHSFAHVRELLPLCTELGLISIEKEEEMLEFASK